jgi:ABC-type dipeptide/oligopeptide/nickel transport system ATPase component
MAHVTLKDGSAANVVLVGDSGAGKSETLEALRSLADEHIGDMKIIFDDMGSLGMRDGVIVGYGTETGAFVRLDDLSPEYAYEQFDRAIFMNPSMVNSRLVIPITKHQHLVKGYRVDMVLYANNYERVDEEMPAIEFFGSAEDALAVFRLGARMAKGTTDEKGIVHTYFANPFGAPQRKAEHEQVAKGFFARMFETGVKVGQIRTRLGIEGYEREGPKSASMELFGAIRNLTVERGSKG